MGMPRKVRKTKGHVPADATAVHIGIQSLCAECGEQETWTLYDRGHDPAENDGYRNYKLCADGPVCHKANYWISFKGASPKTGGDHAKLRSQRPDLSVRLGAAMNGEDPEAPIPSMEERELAEERDPYGDLVNDSKYTKSQQWERGVLATRIAWLTYLAQDRLSSELGSRALVEKGLRMRWMGIYGLKTLEDAPDDVIRLRADEVMNYKNNISYEKFLGVLRPFYEHKYGPFHRKMLAAVLDHLVGIGPDPFSAAGDFEEIGGPARPSEPLDAIELLKADNVTVIAGGEEVDKQDLRSLL